MTEAKESRLSSSPNKKTDSIAASPSKNDRFSRYDSITTVNQNFTPLGKKSFLKSIIDSASTYKKSKKTFTKTAPTIEIMQLGDDSFTMEGEKIIYNFEDIQLK